MNQHWLVVCIKNTYYWKITYTFRPSLGPSSVHKEILRLNEIQLHI